MRKILTALAVVFMAVSVFAQGAAVIGSVTDETGGSLPGASVANQAAFGRITSTIGDVREMQFALKFYF